MSLFQNTVIAKYLKAQNKQLLSEKWTVYKNHFFNPTIQENIRNSKEEQYQGEFLIDLFVNVLGYIKNPTPDFNLTTEYKNVKDSKKADGAIIINDIVKAVIELKGTNTTDLSKIESQAFGYKNNQPKCTYVITSNFEKLRFYIDNAIEHIEFNLFTLTEKDFELLYLCLAFENIKNDIPQKIKKDSVSQEDVITKKLYKDYSLFKRELFQNLVKQNPEFDQLELFKKSQKLLDRFLFIFFAEDRMLLPPNSVRLILQQWKQLQDLDEYTPLYERFKKYFGYLNTGYKGKNYDVYAYNGGLFKPDDILDNITIDDNLLYEHTLKLSEYDFVSEVDVNILGHIFENSLNELDEIKAQLEGQEIDKTKTKRKKDGVFYTPKYITKYIVENTIGKLCEEKKLELSINEEDYITDKKRQKKTIKDFVDKLDTYRKWLLQLTICDPACGSGAFLNQALDFLIKEHSYIDELQAKLFGDSLILTDIENSILENNLFGVDLNEESVEIAKLSLWLRTAQPNRKLNDLNNNIKCGNSLIDDPAVAGEKAFNWQNAFPKVFEKGGFDVIIGNPPYLRVQGIKENHLKQSLFLEKKYLTAKGRYDLYIIFIEKSYFLINSSGKVSFILPHNFINGNLGASLREFLIEKKCLEEILHFGSYLVFDEASTYTCILTLSNNNNTVKYSSVNPKKIFDSFDFTYVNYSKLKSEKWELNDNKTQNVLDKINLNKLKVKDYFKEVARGVVTGADGIFILDGKIENNIFKGYSKELNKEVELESEVVNPILMGNSVSRYSELDTNLYVLYLHEEVNEKTQPISFNKLKKFYPKAYSYIYNFKDLLVQKKIKYKTNAEFWYSLHNSREVRLFQSKKIVVPYLANRGQMSYDESGLFHTNDKCSLLVLRDEYQDFYLGFLAILNSKLLWFYIKNTSSEFSGGYFAFTNLFLNPFPLPNIKQINFLDFNHKAKHLISLNKQLNEATSKFQRTLQRKFELDSLSKKLENWFELTFAAFVKELAKKKIKLTLTEEAEWEDYFLQEQQKALALKQQIDATDKEIDAMVYKLYELTDEEIEIVENS
ncbi:Eco57I restriction-modification methylase domain-containing protein [Polaribacter sp.]|uniref:Eco57I restriction-modification methylase domain-containing protein n=3 Tax=Polaribacter sp. TaxID=1920175 RepID=UPI0040484161